MTLTTSNMKKFLTIKLVILFCLIFLGGINVFAASLELNTEKTTLDKGDIFTVTILLNTSSQTVNTIEGDLKYDSNFISAEALNTGNSFVNFWIEKPNIKKVGLIHFAGMTPGGISTAKGEVLSVVFKTQKTGNTGLELNNTNLYLNDGNGTILKSDTKDISIAINQGVNNNITNFIFNDKIPPEKFNIIRTKVPSLFDGKYFVVFNTSDKQSGLDHYQVCELFKCVLAESPYLLNNQTPFYYVMVKAFDMNGNFTSSLLVSPLLIIVLILFILSILILLFYLYRKYL